MRFLPTYIVPCFMLAILVGDVYSAPTLSPGQSVEVREGDQWSAATLQKIEGRRYQIKYADGTEEWVTIDRIRETSAPAAAGKKAAGSVSLDSPATPIQLKQVKGIEKRATAPIAILPTTKPTATFTDLAPPSGLPFRKVEDLSICPDAPSMAIAIGARKDDDTPILVMDTTRPDASQVLIFTAPEQQVLAVGDAGKLVLSKPTKRGANTLHLWRYTDGEYMLEANYALLENGKNKEPNWARFLTPARVIVRSGFGETYLIDLKTRAQLGYIQCGDLKIHNGGRYLLTSKDQSNLVLRGTDLAVVAEMPDGPSKFCIDPTGTFAATVKGRKVTVTKIANKSTVSETEGIDLQGDFEIIGTKMLLADGTICYDIKTGIPLWKYDAPDGKSVMLANGQMLYVGVRNGQSYACMAAVPDDSATQALTTVGPDKFSISPGAKIKIEGDLSATGNVDEARKSVTTSITSAGHVADDSATKYKLTITIKPGEPDKIQLREHTRMGPPVIREYNAPSTDLSAVLTADGEEIWKMTRKYKAAVMVMPQGNETIQQAIDKAGTVTPNKLGGLGIPTYVVKGAKPGAITTLGESVLTAEGFVSSSAQSK